MTLRRIVCANAGSMLVALAMTLALTLPPTTKAQDQTTITVDRGLESHVDLRYSHALRARDATQRIAPVRVRVSRTNEAGVQRVSFIGNVAGEFDLRDYLAREDGQPLDNMPALPVQVVSHLPSAHGLDLFEREGVWTAADKGWSWRRHYRLLMAAGLALWLALPAIVFTRWMLHRPRPVPPPPPPPPAPTLGEQLATAIRVANETELAVDERAALELLLIRYLSDELGLAMVPQKDYAATLESLRQAPRTAPVVRAVERWLHASSDSQDREASAAKALELLAKVARDAQHAPTRLITAQPAGSHA